MRSLRPLIAEVRKYLRQRGYYKRPAKEFTKRVFLETLESYFRREVNTKFIGILADELLYTTLKKEGELDLPLLHALTEASELDSAWLASRIEVLNHRLKFYLTQNTSFASMTR